MAFENVVKGSSIRGYALCIERRPDGMGGYERVEHIFVLMVSGAIVDIQPKKNVSVTVYSSIYFNSYPKLGYAWNNNKFYLHSGQEQNSAFIEYDPVTLKTTNVFDSLNFNPYYNNIWNSANIRVADFNNFQISTDGHLYLTFFRTNALPCMVRYNTSTESFDVSNQIPDLEAEISQGVNLQTGYNYTGVVTALQGVYSGYVFADDLTHLFDTIIGEATTAGVSFSGQYMFKLHTDDRAVSSVKRRVAGAVNITGVDLPGVYVQRVIDLNNISDRHDIGFNETVPLNWGASEGTTDVMSNLSGITGINDPAFQFGNCFSGGRHAGRFMYYSSFFSGNTNNIGFAYALQDYPGFGIEKGQMIWPLNRTWDRATSLPNNAGSLFGVYKCNFLGIHGFSSSEEYVGFMYDPLDGTTIGYLRPDNLEFEPYDPILNLPGYVISSVNTNEEILAEFDCVVSEAAAPNILINEENAVSESFMDSALFEEIQLILDESGQNAVDVVFSYAPLKSEDAVVEVMANGLPATTNPVAGVVELSPNQLFVGGMLYAGIFINTRSGSSLTQIAVTTQINSIYHSFRFDSSKNFFLGYPNRIVVGNSSPGVLVQPFAIRQALYGNRFSNDYAIISGISLRVKNYFERYAYVYAFNVNTNLESILPNLPNTLNPLSGKTFREALGLTENTYPPNESNAAAASYAAANSLTQQQVIDLALHTCLYSSFEPVSWDNSKCLVSLNRRAVAGLNGIQINTQADGNGTWIDETEGQSTSYPAAYFFEGADPTTLIVSDYKTIFFEVPGFQGVSTLGRLAESTDYVAFLKNENDSGNSVIRVVSKTAIETAAFTSNPITSFEREITISLGSTSYLYGFGSGNQGYDFLSPSYKPNQCFFTEGNNLYVSIITNVTSGLSKPAIYKVDLATGVVTIWARLDSDLNKALNYNPDTNVCFVSVDTVFYAIDNFTGITAPYDII